MCPGEVPSPPGVPAYVPLGDVGPRHPFFPLPRFSPLSRENFLGVRGAACCRRHNVHVKQANDVIDAVNSVAGVFSTSQVYPSPGQKSALSHVWRTTKDAGPPAVSPGPYEAAQELLALGRSYEGSEPTALGHYGEGPISLPSGAVPPVVMGDVLQGTPRQRLLEFEDWLLKDDDQWSRDSDHTHRMKSYCDPALRDQCTYHKFIQQLHDGRILTWTRRPRGRVEPFFVWKKKGSLRLVLDCRQVNQAFKDPPGVSLGSLSALGNLEINDEDVLYVSQADIKDCFWHCLLPHELARFFCLRGAPGELLVGLGVLEVEGVAVDPLDVYYPAIACCPMGWSWAFWFVQMLHEQILDDCGIPPARRLRDCEPAPAPAPMHLMTGCLRW